MGGDFPWWVYPLIVWTIFWKARASWCAARNNQVIWFVAFWVLNTLGILPLIYLIWFRKDSKRVKGAFGKAVQKSRGKKSSGKKE